MSHCFLFICAVEKMRVNISVMIGAKIEQVCAIIFRIKRLRPNLIGCYQPVAALLLGQLSFVHATQYRPSGEGLSIGGLQIF